MTDERRALRSVALQFWVNGVVFASFIPRLPEIRARIDVDLDVLGLLLTLGSLGGLAASALTGRVVERYGTRRVMVSAAFGLVVTLSVVGLADSAAVFLAALIVMHFFDVFTDVAMNLQGSWLSARRATPVMNRLHGVWSIGTVVGGLGATLAATTISLRVHLLIVSALLLATVAYVAPGLLPDAVVERGGHGERRETGSGASTSMAMFAFLAVLAIAVELIPTDWAAIRLAEDFDLSAGAAGLGFVAMTSGMVVGRLGGDAATARLGRDRLITFAAATSAVGLGLATLVPSAPVSVVGFVLAGLGAAVMFPGLYDQAAQAPGRPGAAIGAMTAGIRTGAIALPVLVGTLAATDALSVGAAMAIATLPAALAFGLSSTRSRAATTSAARP